MPASYVFLITSHMGETVFYLLLTITIEDIAMALMELFSW